MDVCGSCPYLIVKSRRKCLCQLLACPPELFFGRRKLAIPLCRQVRADGAAEMQAPGSNLLYQNLFNGRGPYSLPISPFTTVPIPTRKSTGG